MYILFLFLVFCSQRPSHSKRVQVLVQYLLIYLYSKQSTNNMPSLPDEYEQLRAFICSLMIHSTDDDQHQQALRTKQLILKKAWQAGKPALHFVHLGYPPARVSLFRNRDLRRAEGDSRRRASKRKNTSLIKSPSLRFPTTGKKI